MAAHQAPPSMGFSRQEHWSGLPFPSPMHESEKWKWSLSVVSDSSRPHELQPTRLLCPWNSPGQNNGVGSCSLLQGIFPTQGSNPGLPHLQADSAFSRPIRSVQFSHSVVSDSFWSHKLQHAKPPCPSPTPGVYSNSCPSSRWCSTSLNLLAYFLPIDSPFLCLLALFRSVNTQKRLFPFDEMLLAWP